MEAAHRPLKRALIVKAQVTLLSRLTVTEMRENVDVSRRSVFNHVFRKDFERLVC